ncbi:lysophospholipid acyltransferase family protein [Gluconobacter wancherniae]|uniref:lysophospholipid acyltransferase family protein n=1 Tax=Gluconobacter wancherniae TaxID=1307955 RepID=UPI002013623C|nr:lysophospholipid acyltransferase family protein [Gluconobacter wancherniae]
MINLYPEEPATTGTVKTLTAHLPLRCNAFSDQSLMKIVSTHRNPYHSLPMPHPSVPSSSGRSRHSRPVIDANAAFPRHYQTTPSSAGRAFRCARRLATILIWAFWSCAIQAVLVRLPGQSKIYFARFFWRIICVFLGITVRRVGEVAASVNSAVDIKNGKRPVIFVGNHSSWLDIATVGSILPTVFVSKSEVGKWPAIGTIARLGRTIFVSRNRQETARELQEMAERLQGGDNIILFPEGTSSDGSRVLPFLSSFFAIAKPGRLEQAGAPKAPPVLIQPISIVYDRLEGLPVTRNRRSVFSWYGDMNLAPHLWSFGQWRSMRATIILHPPLAPEDFSSRKELANATFEAVSRGAEQLRQERHPDAKTKV